LSSQGTSSNKKKRIPYSFTLSDGKTKHLDFEIQVDASKANRSFLISSSTYDEDIYGFGEQFSTLNFKGHSLPVVVAEKGYGRGLEPLSQYLKTQKQDQGVEGEPHTPPIHLCPTTSPAKQNLFI
jgi:hypothetical protein